METKLEIIGIVVAVVSIVASSIFQIYQLNDLKKASEINSFVTTKDSYYQARNNFIQATYRIHRDALDIALALKAVANEPEDSSIAKVVEESIAAIKEGNRLHRAAYWKDYRVVTESLCDLYNEGLLGDLGKDFVKNSIAKDLQDLRKSGEEIPASCATE